MKQDLGQFKSFLRDYIESVTHKSKGGLYICPLCGSGEGANHTGALSIEKDGQRWKCFSCQRGGDIFDLYVEINHCSLSDATKAIIALYGHNSGSVTRSTPIKRQATGDQAAEADQPRSYAQELENYAAALEGSAGQSYLQGRGITLETMRRFYLGYNARKQTITIPYNPAGTYYGQRSVNPEAERTHDFLKGVKIPLFNAAALYSSDVCFVVESPLCAISITQGGGAAVAISGTGGVGRFLEQIKKKPTQAALILCLDNDKDGRRATHSIANALKAEGIFFLEANIAGEHKDPNEALQHGIEAFQKTISETIANALKARQIETQTDTEAYQQESAAGFFDAFENSIEESKEVSAISTGFIGLDKVLEGGLYEGLYIIGAISSLGKTTLVLQIVDQIAESGQDVIVISLEMARNELLAKSISRLTYKLTRIKELPKSEAKTTRGIATGKRYSHYSDMEIQLIEAAKREYREKISGHVWIQEGVGDIGAEKIREAVKRHISFTGQKPVVVIDYLQILSPYEIRATDKQNTDKAVLELKRISRDYRIPIIAVSSFNRDNYSQPVGMAAFKESGAIEYSSDVLIGLQYSGMDYQESESEKDREKRIRKLIKANEQQAREGKGVEIDLKVLKNRNGGRGMSDPLTFFPMFNVFVEHPEGFTVVDEETPMKPMYL